MAWEMVWIDISILDRILYLKWILRITIYSILIVLIFSLELTDMYHNILWYNLIK